MIQDIKDSIEDKKEEIEELEKGKAMHVKRIQEIAREGIRVAPHKLDTRTLILRMRMGQEIVDDFETEIAKANAEIKALMRLEKDLKENGKS